MVCPIPYGDHNEHNRLSFTTTRTCLQTAEIYNHASQCSVVSLLGEAGKYT